MRLAIITDTHFGMRGESSIFNEYALKFFEQQFFPYLEKQNIKKIIHLGDVVDRQKYTTYEIANSWRTRFWNRIRQFKISVDVLVGNHDASNNRYSNVPNAIEELWGEFENIRVFSECCVQYYDGIPIALIPWINKTNYDSTMEFIQKVPASIAMAHLELKGFEMDKGNVAKFGMDRELFQKFQIVMSGHYHHRSTDGKIWYLGNPYEITWADYNDPRGFHVFDTHTRELEFIQNPFKMHYKLHYDDTVVTGDEFDQPSDLQDKVVRVVVANRGQHYETFLKQIQDAHPYKLEIEDLTDVDVSSTAEVTGVEDTSTIIDLYIDETEVTLDKNRLKVIMRDLYREAHDNV